MFWGLLDPDPDPLVEERIRILLSSSKNTKKNLNSYCLVTTLKNDVNLQVFRKQKNVEKKKKFFVGVEPLPETAKTTSNKDAFKLHRKMTNPEMKTYIRMRWKGIMTTKRSQPVR
jgi:hypothetical protein